MGITDDSLKVLELIYKGKLEGERYSKRELEEKLPSEIADIGACLSYLKQKNWIRQEPDSENFDITAQGIEYYENDDSTDAQSNELHNESKANIDDSELNSGRDIINGPKIEQSNSNTQTYDIEKEDYQLLEEISIFLTNRFEDRTMGLAGGISLLASIVTLWGVFKPEDVSTGIFGYIPALPSEATYVGIGLFVVGSGLFSVQKYKNERKCDECGALFSLKEVGTPKRIEKDVRGGVREKTIRHYECQNCGEPSKKVSKRFIEDNDDK